MEENKKTYKSFEGKKVLVLTNSNFKYNTNNLKVLDNAIFFVDKFGNELLISFSEIKLIQEVRV